MLEIFNAFARVAVTLLVPCLALGTGLAVRFEDIRYEAKNPVFWRTLLVAVLAVPMLAVLVAIVLPLGPVAQGVLVLMAVSPGAPLMINTARGRSGNVPLAVVVAVALTLAVLVTLPIGLLVLNSLFPYQLQASVPALVGKIVPRLLVPLALGIALRQLWPKGADVLAPVVRVLFLVSLAVVSIFALIFTWQELGLMTPLTWVALVAVTFGAAVLGDVVAGGTDPRDRATAAYAVVLGNPAVAIYVASVSYPALKVIPVIVAYVVLRAVLILPYLLVSQRRLARAQPG